MLICPVCNETYCTISNVIKHIKFKHKFVNRLLCQQIHRFRTFQNIYNFKRHLILKHEKDENISKLPTSNSNNCINLEQISISEDEILKVPDTTETSDVNLVPDTTETSIVNLPELELCLSQNALMYVSKFYNNYSLPRNIVQNIIHDTSALLEEPIDILKKKLHNSSNVISNESSQELIFMLDSFKNMFTNLFSEHMRFKQFKASSTFISPVSVILGQILNSKTLQNRVTAELTDITCQYIPIHKTLKAFLELPSVFDQISLYISDLQQSEVISNIIQSEMWKNIANQYKNRMVLPLFVYGDDFEVANPLGSHAGIYKVCGIYFSIACLPPEYSSQLENIFLLQLCHSTDVKEFGNGQNISRYNS